MKENCTKVQKKSASFLRGGSSKFNLLTGPPPLPSAADEAIQWWLNAESGDQGKVLPENAKNRKRSSSCLSARCDFSKICHWDINHVRYLVCTELLPEAKVRASYIHSQTVFHPLQERHPALTLLLKRLLPQCLRLQLTAHIKLGGSKLHHILSNVDLFLTLLLPLGSIWPHSMFQRL